MLHNLGNQFVKVYKKSYNSPYFTDFYQERNTMTKKLWFGLIAWLIMGTSVYYLGKVTAKWMDENRLNQKLEATPLIN